MALSKTRRGTWADHGVQFTGGEHAGEGLGLGRILDDDIRRQFQDNFFQPSRFLIPPTNPGDIGGFETVIFFQEKPHPDVSRQLVLWHADAFALEIRRGLDAAVVTDIDRGVTKRPRREDRHGNIGTGARSGLNAVATQRQLTDVVVGMAKSAEEDFFGILQHKDWINSVNLYFAVHQWPDAIVIAHSDG